MRRSRTPRLRHIHSASVMVRFCCLATLLLITRCFSTLLQITERFAVQAICLLSFQLVKCPQYLIGRTNLAIFETTERSSKFYSVLKSYRAESRCLGFFTKFVKLWQTLSIFGWYMFFWRTFLMFDGSRTSPLLSTWSKMFSLVSRTLKMSNFLGHLGSWSLGFRPDVLWPLGFPRLHLGVASDLWLILGLVPPCWTSTV